LPLLFSYGTLQREDVQVATFGRTLSGRADELLAFERVPAAPGGSGHANVIRGAPGIRVAGVAFEVSETELAAADEYEHRDGYTRIETVLASGRTAWVYVSRETT
jgi:gamma-glutamylcyclotransferase (GGCT)/AIG2-like uncharacterized protein YtfP